MPLSEEAALAFYEMAGINLAGLYDDGGNGIVPGYVLKPLDILLVEQHMLMRRVLRDVMKQLGISNVRMASTYDLALDLIAERRPDIIVTDWSPGLDAIRFVRELRKSRGEGAFIPVVILSAFSELAHVCKARDAGVTEFLTKPVSAKSLYKRIVSVIEKERHFVRTRDFFGPDRRRRSARAPEAAYKGPERRGDREVRAKPYSAAQAG
ncbi:MAG: response regulator [Alphaproteobacteria bacterium]|nr:response regulator [Alphaproteobacteria bacterium]